MPEVITIVGFFCNYKFVQEHGLLQFLMVADPTGETAAPFPTDLFLISQGFSENVKK